MDNIVRLLFDIGFDFLGFHISIQDFVSTIFSICDWGQIQASSIWGLVSTIHELTVPIGLSLLVMFTLIEFVRKAMEVDKISWESIAMLFIKFLIVKYCVQNSFQILNLIMNICQDYFNSILPLVNETASIDLADTMASLIDGNMIEQAIMMVLIVILYIPFVGTMIGILIQTFQRIGKLVLAFACSPIPLSMGVSDDHRSSCKSFFMFIVALGLEGVMIIICAKIYVLGLTSIGEASGISKMIAIMFANGLFMALVSYGSTMAEKLTGGN